MKYEFEVRHLEDGRATVKCIGGIPSQDAESIVTHILLAGACGEGVDPLSLLARALTRVVGALERESAETGSIKVSEESWEKASSRRCANPDCGKPFRPEHGNHRYCQDCGERVKKRLSQRRYRAKRKEGEHGEG